MAVNVSAARVVMTEGTTRVGAYLKIWNMYIKDISDVSPVRVTTEKIEEQKPFIYCALVESSPALYCLKKLLLKILTTIRITVYLKISAMMPTGTERKIDLTGCRL